LKEINMNASKTLTTVITAATILGAVSFVYAQTTDSTAPPADQSSQMTAPSPTATPDATSTPSAAPDSSTAVQPSTSTPADNNAAAPSTSTDSNAAPADLAPKPDRN
jgi:cell division protein FtsN